MYKITEIILCCYVLSVLFSGVNSKTFTNYVKFIFLHGKNKLLHLFFNKNIENKEQINEENDNKDKYNDNKDNEKQVNTEKYENKYLEQFKQFPNRFEFTEAESTEVKKVCEELVNKYKTTRNESISETKTSLSKIQFIKRLDDEPCEIDLILELFNIEEECDEIKQESSYKNELYRKLKNYESELENKMLEFNKCKETDEELYDKMLKEAYENVINKKLDNYINNFILENTPAGNIYMRYNNSKHTFEYFSNNSIPYRYLEVVGRKYVMTYWCKPIFVDIDEEIKNAEEKNEEDKTKKVIPQLMYNDKKDLSFMKMKNRSNKYDMLIPHIKQKINENKQQNHLLKENANRYTWHGRLSDFCPLKKVDKKVLYKNLSLTYADFKKKQMQMSYKENN